MEHYLQPDFVKTCFSDLCSVHLTIVGICLSIFTLLYSFIFSKRTELSNYSESLKSKFVNPLIAQKYGQTKIYIQNLASIISKCKYALLLSCFIWLICWICKIFILPCMWKNIILSSAIILTLFEFCLSVFWLWKIAKQYHSDINI